MCILHVLSRNVEHACTFIQVDVHIDHADGKIISRAVILDIVR